MSPTWARLFRRTACPTITTGGNGSLGPGECYGIEKASGDWTVYYSERGAKNVLNHAANEDAACRLMIGYINRSMQHRFGRTIAVPK